MQGLKYFHLLDNFYKKPDDRALVDNSLTFLHRLRCYKLSLLYTYYPHCYQRSILSTCLFLVMFYSSNDI